MSIQTQFFVHAPHSKSPRQAEDGSPVLLEVLLRLGQVLVQLGQAPLPEGVERLRGQAAQLADLLLVVRFLLLQGATPGHQLRYPPTLLL